MRYSDETHRAMGRHSNIPECCIDFWVELIRLPLEEQDKRRGTKTTKANYVQCPKCRETKRVNKLNICTTNCLPFLKSIGYGTVMVKYLKPPEETKILKYQQVCQ